MTLLIDANGRFAGYASVFNERDQGGDTMMPGAFAKCLRVKGAAGIRLLFQHDPREPVGVWDRLVEDRRGLYAEGHLVAGVPRADALRHLIAARAIDGLSIGFRAERATRDPRSGARSLFEVDLWEVSLVTFPMLGSARISPLPRGPEGARTAAMTQLLATLST
jgi:HK97 family phage prohead protease